MQANQPSRNGLPLRLLFYVFITAMGARLLVEGSTLAAAGPADFYRIWREDGPVEWLQVAVLVATAALLVSRVKDGFALLAVLALCGMFFRELDGVFDAAPFADAHLVPTVASFGALGLAAWWRRATLPDDLRAFAQRPAFALTLFGVALFLGYAQTFGDSDVYRMLAPEHRRAATRFVEEGLELLGYLWLLFASIEERLSARAAAPGA